MPRRIRKPASRTRGEMGSASPRGPVLMGTAHSSDQKFGSEHSCQNFGHHSRRLHAREFLFQALKSEVQLVVIESEQVQHRSVQIANLDRILHDFVSHFVGFPMADAGFYSATGQPYGERAG